MELQCAQCTLRGDSIKGWGETGMRTTLEALQLSDEKLGMKIPVPQEYCVACL